MGRDRFAAAAAGKRKKSGALRRLSSGNGSVSDTSSQAGSLSQLSRAPSFSNSEKAPSLGGGGGRYEGEPPSFVPRLLLLEREREIRSLQDRCRDLETRNTSLQAERDLLQQDHGPDSPQIRAIKEEEEGARTARGKVQLTARGNAQSSANSKTIGAEVLNTHRTASARSPSHSPRELEEVRKPAHGHLVSSLVCGVAFIAVPLVAIVAMRSRS